jgi:iron(III) transport system substrate-binding protein
MQDRNFFRGNPGRLRALFVLGTAGVALAVSAGALRAGSPEVNVYSARKEALIKPPLDRFSEETGITVNLVTGKAGQLHERLAAEGRNSPADLFITVDAGNLHRAKVAGLLQPAAMPELDALVPAPFRDPDGAWYGLSLRARVIVYAVDRVDPSELSSYEGLADPKWAGRLLVRSSSNVYNQSLIASMIDALGEEGAERWARGIVANMARHPQGGDTDQIRAVAAGEGDVALVNTYYYARLVASDRAEDRAIAERTRLFFPDQEGRGTHVNVSGAGITAHAPNPDNARRLLAFLASEEGQRLFAELNHEIPVDPRVPASAIVESWGEFKGDDLPLATLGVLNGAAIRLADRADWR